MSNRLADEVSPYLQQHRDNPVDWYPWGDEAFAAARERDVPILLSVGYSACHWCHVMEHESFADSATAEQMNAHFVNVKVDREERPDVDALYMQAVQQMTGHGGWPMTVFLTPDGSPFFGGTYYPPEPRHGMPSFTQILAAIHQAWSERRGEVVRSAQQLTAALAQGATANPARETIDHALLDAAVQRLLDRWDRTHGGFGGAPKFPQPMILEFLLRAWRIGSNEEALRAVRHTLDRMASSGTFDQIGGGFHRYATDARWLVPHFEKMLYDNAQLASVYTEAFEATGEPNYRTTALSVIDYVLREMRHPDGGFFSSQDADSEGEEGRFYVWTEDEIDNVLGAEQGEHFRRAFDIRPGGNWEGRSIPHRPRGLDEVAEELGTDADRLAAQFDAARAKLYAAREKRVHPHRDEKIIAGWNAMMIRALARAGRVFGREADLAAATEAADFLLDRLRADGYLLRSWRDGQAKIGAFLDDYALTVIAFIELYEATFDFRWIQTAHELAEQMIDRFRDPEQGIFFDAPAGAGGLPVRPRDLYDNAVPSGTSAAALALLRLGRFLGEPEYERMASDILHRMGRLASEVPQGFANLLNAIQLHLTPSTEIVIVGPMGRADTASLLEVVRNRYLPFTTVALLDAEGEDPEAASLPLFQGRTTREGRAAAYVCKHFTCKAPVVEPAALALDVDALMPRSESA